MSCSQCRGIEREFDRRWVKMEGWKHRLLGPPRTTRRLVAALFSDDDVQGASLLDVGGGLGYIQRAFAERGAGHIEVVDAAPAYLDAARRLAREAGYADRAVFRAGDFVELAPDVEAADVVTLDRVICCYDDAPALLAAAAGKCRRLYGLVYPRDRRLVRAARRGINFTSRLKDSPYRFFVHEEALVREVLQHAGLHLRRRRRSTMWNIEVYGR